MNERGIVRCTCALTLVGTSPVMGTFTPSPPKNGKILRIEAAFTAPATKIADLLIQEGVAGDIRISYSDESADFVDAPGGTPYSSNDLRVSASTDDVTSMSDVAITLDVEAV